MDKEPDLERAVDAAVEAEAPRRLMRPVVIGGQRKPRKQRKRKDVFKSEQWYRMTAFWDDDAKSVMKVGDADIALCGWVPPDMDVAVVLVPTSVTQEQGLALQKIIEAQVRKPVLVLTNNTQLVRLKPISDSAAKKLMEKSDGEVVQISPGANGEGQGERVRADGGESDASDLRPARADQGDGGGDGREGSEPSSEPSED